MKNSLVLSQMNIKQKIIVSLVLVSALVLLTSLFIALKDLKTSLLDANMAKTKNIVELAYGMINEYSHQVDEGILTAPEAKEKALQKIDQMKYDGKNYLWVTAYNDDMLAHPTLEGKNIADVADKNGVRFLHDGVVIAKEKGDGFVHYIWTKQGESASKLYPKVSYFLAFPKWNWVIASGCYLDQVDNVVFSTFVQICIFTVIVLVLVILAAILTVVKDIVNSMKLITVDLEGSSEQIKATSSELSDASTKLAEGSTEQAASIQETSSTLEETSSMVQQNHSNTQQAALLAKQSKDYASRSNQQMTKMISAMEELKKSSDEIAKIIKVIDDIAFQTNILSLNAAVEAARAGDVGKGFAVVAEEVRTLAQKSAQAAKDTTVIIEKNINLSQTGEDITRLVQSSILEIDEQSKKVSELLDEISVATNEQSQGIEQINKAVSQIEAVINSNAQASEESAAASKGLYGQTLNMNEVILRLKTLVDGTSATYSKISNMASARPVQRTVVSAQKPVKEVKKIENKKVQPKAEPKKIEKKAETPASKSKSNKDLTPDDIIPLGNDMDF